MTPRGLRRALLLSAMATPFAGAASGAPAWVTTSGANVADMDFDPVNDRAWLKPSEIAISSLLSCSRASQKWVRTSAGVLTTFANNALPYTDLGLLPEAAATNVCLHSQGINTTNWTTSSNIVASDNNLAAPDGTTTAELITDANTGTTVQVYAGRNVTVSGAGTQCASVYVKAGANVTRLRISTLSFDAGATADTYFDLTNGTVSLKGANHSDAQILALANGWYLCWVVFSTTTDLAGAIRLAMGTSNVTTIASDGTKSFYLWQAQVEAGSRPSSPILTTTGSVTRPADIITFADLTWFSGTADSFYAEWLARNVAGLTAWAWDAANDKALDEQSGMSPRLAGATVGNTVAADALVKVAGRMVANDFALTMAGGTVATDTSETAPGTLAASRVGCDLAGANHLGAFIRRLASFKVAITDTDLQALSDP